MLLLISLVNTKLTSLLSPTPIVCCDRLFVYKLPLLSYQFLFNSDLNFKPSGNLSTIWTAFPSISPLFVITILYSIITVAPLIFLECISAFANCLLSYVYVFVLPSFVCTVILLIYFFNPKSKSLFSINPISTFFKSDSAVSEFVNPAVTVLPSIPIVLVIASEFLNSITPSFWYSVNVYAFVSYKNTTIYCPLLILVNSYSPFEFVWTFLFSLFSLTNVLFL